MANGRQDLRLAFGWPRHVKTRRLIRRCGYEGAFCVVALWCYAGENSPDGVFHDMSPVEIEEAAGWTGASGLFHAALVEIGWLESDGLTIHDWAEEQPWVANRPERVACARDAGVASGEARRKKQPKRTTRSTERSTTRSNPISTSDSDSVSVPVSTSEEVPASPGRGEGEAEPEPERSRTIRRGTQVIQGGAPVLAMEADPGWRPSVYPYRDEGMSAFQRRTRLNTREANATMNFAREWDSWDVRPAVKA